MNRLELGHPTVILWMHWVNVLVLAIMIWSGLRIFWANDICVVRVGRVTFFHFFPDWFYRTFFLDRSVAVGMAYHFTFAWVFALNGFLYVLYTMVSAERRRLLPNRSTPYDWYAGL